MADLPVNRFKAGLKAGTCQIGLWTALPGTVPIEILSGCGFDWLVLDTEHAPSDPLTVLPQLQTLVPHEVAPVVRPAWNDKVLIKRFLDIGAQTLLVPYVQTREEAEAAVAAMRYPPRGIRGVAGSVRASAYGQVPDYILRAEEELCLIVQVETAEALARLPEIASVDGVDAVFIGPADLSASMGHPGDQMHPEVIAAIEGAIRTLVGIGVPAGILTGGDFARRCIDLGALFVAVGSDAGVMAKGARELAASFKNN
ncbi:aldolase/citrate lyase family protein [Pseudooceanicola sp.]|uniref:aldolase/citrate lyase family protein n=1 Tax=Pseudooceanicola sp. TaxID=1914328 RepID=UPI002635530E|nr:aldolase/citrate lyase family protein [Pseudooceanicola sp.]MDF1856137.1 aldolase/citrate lyase family protein [Pseudooceanicola sp.]